MSIEEYLKEKKELVDRALKEYVPGPEQYPTSIHQAIHYSLFPGGKRLRPALALAVGEMLGADASSILPAACGVELIHTYSLIHDDLPAIDDDDLRRGRPTSHKVFGEAIAILAGDALLTMAFEVIARETVPPPGQENVVARVVAELARASGISGMVAGQVIDIESEGQQVEADTLDFIHTNKTAALYAASARLGAILSGAGGGELEAIGGYGRSLGLAFQVVDDILNVVGDEAILGKPVGSDAAANKATYPGCHGIEASRAQASELIREAKAQLAGFDGRARTLCALADFVLSRDY